MKPILWDLSGFNISMKGQYADIYALERDIGKNSGSSNFSEMDSLDWFLLNKTTGQISFLLLTVPSILKKSSGNSNYDDDVFNSFLIKMLAFCNQEAYEAMDDMDNHYLLLMNQLEEDCQVHQYADVRVLQVIDFIKHLKSTFYDIEID